MNTAPLLAAPLAVQIHILAVTPAVFLGLWLLVFSAKGTPPHRAAGYVYLTLMGVTAGTSFFIHHLPPVWPGAGFGWIHVISALTVAALVRALAAARSGNIKAHRRAMIAVYIGGVLVPGAFSMTPPRIMHQTLFG